ncbi:MAG: amino acid adenylation domain-containing protein [Pyrinomonadaceae bacterium]
MRNVEEIYPLSPLQQGILYHTLHEQEFSMYFEIITWVIEGEVNVAAYEQAWQRAVDLHPVLRSSFVWESVDEPLQVVRRRARLPMTHLDWRELSVGEQDESLSALFAEERRRGFDLMKPPLMRVTLVRTGDATYRFVWCYHHGLVDGWSCSLIFNSVFAAYEALCRGAEPQLAAPRPFAEYIDWVRGQDMAAAEAYWRRALKGFTAPTPLGFDAGGAPRRDREEAATKSYREQAISLPPGITGELTRLARRRQLTLNTICLGAWAVLLSRYSGERDVVCGVAVSGRPPMLAGVETMVGMLVNTLPARLSVEPERTVLRWLEEIQREQVELRQYEYSPLVSVHGWSDVPRNTPLFETVLSFENHPVDYSLLRRDQSAQLHDVVHHHTATGIPVNLTIEPGEELLIKIFYDFGRLGDATVRRMLRHLARLLESIAADSLRRLSELSLLAEEERELLLSKWSGGPRIEPPAQLLHEMFEAQAARTPAHVALVAGLGRYTYEQLNGRANRLARRLRASGVCAEVPVAVCAERSAEMVAALLAILKAGGAYLPLDPAYPRERLGFMLEDARPRVLLTERRLLERLPPEAVEGAEVMYLDEDAAGWEPEAVPGVEAAGTTADNLAYFIYTSGSTGRPKGVAITHRSAVVFLHWARTVFGDEQLAGVLASTSISFDLSVFELFAPLSRGGKVILAENALQLPLLEAAGEVTLVNTVPSAMTELVRMRGLPASVRTVNLAGEALPRRLVRQLYELGHVEHVYNLYGPSEDTTYSTYTRVSRDDEDAPHIGRPVGNTHVYVLGAGLESAPVGVAGELYIGGSGLARGYHRRPSLTAERFVPNPYSAEPGARMYRTGDLARWREDGALDFLGRRDHQIKLRGFRIELGETEAALDAHPAVDECVVTAREDAPGDMRLVAYVVPSRRRAEPLRSPLSGEEWARALAGHQHVKLPNGMVVAGHSSLQTSGLFREIFEDLVYLRHGIEIKDGDCVLDVGANIGLFTLFVKQHARGARVYAFEPLPPNFEALRANVSLYGLDANLFECGLSRRPGTATFTFYPHAAAMSGIGSHVEEDKQATRANVGSWLERFGPAAGTSYGLDEFVEQYLQSESYACRLTTLSEVIREQRLERIDLLKLDVEKSELDVLESVEEEDWAKIRQLVVEVHTDELLERISELLRRRGFDFAVEKSELVADEGQDLVRVYMLYARQQAESGAAANGHRTALTTAPPAAAALSPAELRDFLGERLPEYMIPSAFVVLDELPLTPNGKVDRKALPAPGQPADEEGGGFVAPRTPVEEIVAGICAAVLNRNRVSVTANFFDLGGHSLLAAQVISRVRETFKVELSLRKLFLRPTVEGLAQHVEESLRAGEGIEDVRVGLVPREGDLPLSFAQRRLWFLDQLEPGHSFYNIPVALALSGVLRAPALEAALTEVIRRHEALRTTFASRDGRPVQIVGEPMSVLLKVTDLSTLAEAERRERTVQLVKEEAGTPFDLTRGPLLRAQLLRLEAEEHVLLLTMHHIASDGWSLGVLVREVAIVYEAELKGEPARLPELPVQYVDYAVWQREYLQGERLERQLTYWREQLAGAPAALELPNDRPRPAAQSHRGSTHSFNLTPELSKRLEELSRGEGVTLFMTLLAAYQTLLWRYSGQRDILVGSPVAGRARGEFEGLIGFFVNTLALRTHLSPSMTFMELLGRVRETCLGAYAHQDLPFERLVEELEPERDLSRAPLFQSMLVLQHEAPAPPRLGQVGLSEVKVEWGTAKFDLTLLVREAAETGGLRASLEYNTDILEAETVRRMCDNLVALLTSIVERPQARLGELEVLGAEERRRLLVEWNGTAADYPRRLCLHQLFEAQAARTPAAVAVVFGEESLTYGELDERADLLARRLRRAGVAPDATVGILMERSLELSVALLGVLKAGGAYVPLDPEYPRERLAFMLSDSRARVLLTERRVRERFAELLVEYAGQVIAVDDARATFAVEGGERFESGVTAEHLCYVIYTSGSTGQPKGAMLHHRGVVNCMLWMQETYKLDESDSFLFKTSLNFDPSVWEFFWPLAVGARVVIARPGEQADMGALVSAINTRGVTSVYFVPSMLRLFLEDPRAASATTLRRVICGGEKLPPATVARFFETLGAELHHSYGPTETSIAATESTCERRSPHRVVSIGRPLANTQTFVLDSLVRPVPVGVAGELYLGGDGVGRGYLGRPGLTAERFIPDPFSGEPGARMYRTGDVVRYLSGGELEYLGRCDNQVKLRGYRIEPGEIEVALRQHPSVTDCLVLARDEGQAERARLVAYVVASGEGFAPDNGDSADAQLRRHLDERLPAHMIPSAFVVLDELPLMPNGKVDRKALPEPGAARAAAVEHVAPRTPVEEVLCSIWAEVLGVERVSVNDNFFELGGHSLLATQVASRGRVALGVELPLRALFTSPTVESLAREVEAARRGGKGPEVPPVGRAPREGDLPLSFAQQRLWFLDQLEPGGSAYNMPAAVRLVGVLDVAALGRALSEVVSRHEVLRTTFFAPAGEPVQVVAPPAPVPLPVTDLSALPEAKREAEAERLAVEEAQRPFDLAVGPPSRASLIRLSTQEHRLLLTMHHIVSDGWSMGVLVREMTALYEAFVQGRPSPLAELPVQYADYAVWQRGWLRGAALEGQLSYWKQQLVGAPAALELPTDRPRPAVRSYKGARQRLVLSDELSGSLRHLSRREGASLFMTLLAAFKVLLGGYSGQQDIVVGAPVAGRNTPEVEGLVGFFLNTLVLRTDLSGDPTFRELLGRVRQVALGAYEHQDIPFEKLLDELRPERDLSRPSLFQVFFNMLNLPDSRLELSGLTLETLAVGEAEAKFDLTLYVNEEAGRIVFDFVYNTDLFDGARVAEMLRQFEYLLSQVAENPQEPVGRYSLVTPSARRLLPDPAEPLNSDWVGSVHSLFEARARMHPGRVAVADAGQIWTYEELNRRSNRVANYLLAHGIRPGDVVAIYSHRSAPLVQAVLGVLKAGAAFTILDPAYPAARLIDYLSIARPRGWVQLTEAAQPEKSLAEAVESLALGCRLEVGRAAGPEAASDEDPHVEVGPNDLAYVAFTSGSTGRPKGVLGRQGPLTHFLPWLSETFGLDETDRYSMLSGLSHDPLHRDIFTPLCLGAAITIPDPAEMTTPGYVAGWMEREHVSVAHLTPAMGQLLTEGASEAGREVRTLRRVFLVGDVLTRSDVSRLRGLAPGVECVNYYGSTETQRAVSYFVVPEWRNDAGQTPGKEILCLGKGIKDVQLLVLKPGGRLAGVGEAGEIYVRSPHLALGYLGDERLSSERFVNNPFTREEADRLYRTGDLGRYLPDGNVEPLGRADQQVKIRGFRVEPGEVEAALIRHVGVRECVVVAREDAPGGKRLVAYVVAEPGASDTAEALRRHLKEGLPDYMVPSVFVTLDALPLTPNGKVDRKALPPPEGVRGGGEHVAPRTPVEEVLCSIWAEVLGVERVSVNDNFFELGGHSLLATQVVSRIRQSLNPGLGLRELFEYPSVAELAERVGQSMHGGVGEGPPLAKADRTRGLPLSFSQQRLWFLDQLEPNSPFYNIHQALSLKGRLDVAALGRALTEVVRRHEALRTTFASVEGRPEQVVHEGFRVELPLLELGGTREEREAEARRLAVEEAQRPFDLAAGPLLRASLLRLYEEEHTLLFTMHHIVADGWSMGVLVREMTALYEAYSSGKESPLAELPAQYADYAAWQHEYLSGETLERQLSYWRGELAGAPALLELPTDRPRPPVQSYRGAEERFVLPAGLVRRLRRLGRGEGVTLFMMLLAGFDVLLYRHAHQDDIVVGTPVANRSRRELEDLIGFFVNSVAMRIDLSGGPSFLQLLGRVRESALGAYAHQDVPFERLVEELRPERDVSRPPVFQVLFALQNAPTRAAAELPGLLFEALDVEGVTAKFDLSVQTAEAEGGEVYGLVEYNTDLFDAATVRRMFRHYEALLAAAAETPAMSVAELPLLSEGERRQLLVEWNQTATDYPRHLCLHQFFEAQAARTPAATAVVCGGVKLSYEELNGRANRLARHLRGLGVGAESRVGVCLGRSAEMFVALLGVMKAGGAYVPLDPQYPQERLAFMAHDAGLKVLITEEALLPALPAQEAQVLCLDSSRDLLAAQEAEDLGACAEPGHLAYVIYTSGSTGRPKGVLIDNRSLVNTIVGSRERFGIGAGDVMPSIASFSFDISLFEVLMVLTGGGTCVALDKEEVLDTGLLVERLAHVTLLHTVPSLMKQLVGFVRGRGAGVGFEHLRRIFIGGDLVPAQLLEEMKVVFPRTRIEVLYGPTEAAIICSSYPVPRDRKVEGHVIGRPLDNAVLRIYDRNMNTTPVGVYGEIYIGGEGVARGYLDRPELTAQKFVTLDGQRFYRSGDRGRYLASGDIEFAGRVDEQVKLRGYRIEPGEIEAVLREHAAVRDVAVVAREDGPGEKRLVAYVVADGGAGLEGELRALLGGRLPDYMVPAAFVALDALPLTSNGKLDRGALPASGAAGTGDGYAPPQNKAERLVAEVWQELLRVEKVGRRHNFFELGGHSLLLVQVRDRLRELFGREVPIIELFRHPTVSSLAEFLSSRGDAAAPDARAGLRAARPAAKGAGESGVAIIGMAGRFPGARNLEEFWENLRDGVESIRHFSDDELKALGVDAALLADPRYVKAASALDGADLFDAQFFGINPREAEVMDPQQRLFLETAWEALENAGYDSATYGGLIGVYAGVGVNGYMLYNLFGNGEFLGTVGTYQAMIGNDKDHLPTRVSYKLNLNGPSVNVQTACSTSLVAVHLACRALLDGETDIALAGGVSVAVPRRTGYLYEEGGIASPDGHCRAFDASARGTVGGDGLGIVVLKRLADAVADGDTIYAVIKGSAINNDGALKVGYTAPSVEGQRRVIEAALAAAGVSPETVGYVEAHGTGTALGDPIEIAALTQAFRGGTKREGFCALGSVKTNIGHTDAAAGVAGLLKTALALRHKLIPPTLHYERPNPEIDFEHSPFRVNTVLSEWKAGTAPRRAGVSSFGMGGTNAHVVLEEAPPRPDSGEAKPYQLLVLSAKTEAALEAATAHLADYLRRNPGCNPADVAHTLQTGRRALSHRRVLVCRGAEDGARALETADPQRVLTSFQESEDRPVAFIFPGQGSQHVNMGLDLYRGEPVFRHWLDTCAELLQPRTGLDLRELLYPGEARAAESERLLRQTAWTQPALFAVEYALARLWMEAGGRPAAMIGHSLGEYVAACLAGVFSLEDALALVAARGRLIQGMPGGSMLGVALDEEQLLRVLGESSPALCLAAVNAPAQCVVSGPDGDVDELQSRLTEAGVNCRRLAVSHALHSQMLDPVAGALREALSRVELSPPRIPFISNVTGGWITAAEATDPAYWVRHMRETVRFSAGLTQLLKDSDDILLEVGPGRNLSTLVRQHPVIARERAVIPSMRRPREGQSDLSVWLNAAGLLWLAGKRLDWGALYAGEQRARIPLPTYPFERRRYWVEPRSQAAEEARKTREPKAEVADWFYLPSWKRSLTPPVLEQEQERGSCWLLFAGDDGLGPRLAERLRAKGHEVVCVTAGAQFGEAGELAYSIDPARPTDYDRLLLELSAREMMPRVVVHLWAAAVEEADTPEGGEESGRLGHGFYSLLYLTQALARQKFAHPVRLEVVTGGAQRVSGEEATSPAQAATLGLVRVIPQEYPNLTCRNIDLVPPVPESPQEQRQIENLLRELSSGPEDSVVAYRGRDRWVQTYEAVRPAPGEGKPPRLREGGVYLIVGGLGKIGLLFAAYLARTVRAKLILTGRSAFPSREERAGWVASQQEDDPVSSKIRKLAAVEELGAEVLVYSADVANRQQMQQVLDEIDRHFGALHGVIHSAGVANADAFRLIQETDREVCEKILRPKVEGVLTLESLLAGRELDFCILQSSLASVLGGLGFAAYSAANLFMDAVADRQHQGGGPHWMSVNWDAWEFNEENLPAAGAATPPAAPAITPKEAVETIHRIFSFGDTPRLAVSTFDLQARIRQWIKFEQAGDAAGDGAASLHSRPQLRNPYVEPRDEVEASVANIWQELLGIERVGVYDDYFELGGHSLLATQIVTRVRAAFNVDLPLRTLFEEPTVASMAHTIATSRAAEDDGPIRRADGNGHEQLLAEIDDLSAEELEAFLRSAVAEDDDP